MKKSLIALAFGTLALGMSEFVMMGILPDIARSLGVSIPEAGHLISAYALGVCFGAPLMVLVARKRPLKQILLALTAMIAAGNLCASLAPDYWSLLGLRFVSGLPHGAFFGVGSIVAERVADAGKRTEAVSIMIVGMTVANLFGVPLGTYISNVLTWRATFGIVAVWGVVALLLVRLWVPRMEPLPDTGLKGQFRFLRSLAPWLVLLSVMLGNGGIFCWYSYVSPLMIHASGFTADDLTLIIMLAGFGMFAGNIIGGHFSDRFTPEKVVRFTLATAAATLLAIYFGAHVRYLSVALMVLAAGIEQMQVHHRMQQHRPAVAFAARSRSHDNAGGIDHRKKFRTVIASHGGDIYVYKSRRSANRAGRIPCPREPYNDTPARGQSAGRRSRRPAHCPD